MSAPHQELDALASLEERIHKAVELVSQLRAENEALRAENEDLRNETKALRTSNDAAIQEAAAATAGAEQAAGELNALRAERKQVRLRIEKLLGHIDQLSAG
ncbi:MAG TPA: cell division protein ZapB [Bryobacteraceae bacterium]|nr:cell division protein ZapB [Bryobacteraceae bacterium]HXJ37631.1 cell division protein ZapB [Bryobacteraceae bacterium]